MPTIPKELIVSQLKINDRLFWHTEKRTFIHFISQDILENDKIVKVGVESKRDADLLYDDYGILVRSTMDLRYLADTADCVAGGLGQMSENYLNIKLNKKRWDMHLHWESLHLKPKEIDYAAKDVQVAIELFKYFANKLQSDKLQNQPVSIRELIDKYCAFYFDARYYRKSPPKNANSAEQHTSTSDQV